MAKSWVEHYERDKKPAMAELLTMLFEVNMSLYSLDVVMLKMEKPFKPRDTI